MEREINKPSFFKKLVSPIETLLMRFRMRAISYSRELVPLDEKEETRIGKILSTSHVVNHDDEKKFAGLFEVAERVRNWGDPAKPDLLLFSPRLLEYDLEKCWITTTSDGQIAVINLGEGAVYNIPPSEVREVSNFGRRMIGPFGRVLSFLSDDDFMSRPEVLVDPSYKGRTVVRIDIYNTRNNLGLGDTVLLDWYGRNILQRKVLGKPNIKPTLAPSSSEVQLIST